jgi:hypothetical protein
MTVGSCPSITATTEFVVPRSIPMIFDISILSSFRLFFLVFSSDSTCTGTLHALNAPGLPDLRVIRRNRHLFYTGRNANSVPINLAISC